MYDLTLFNRSLEVQSFVGLWRLVSIGVHRPSGVPTLVDRQGKSYPEIPQLVRENPYPISLQLVFEKPYPISLQLDRENPDPDSQWLVRENPYQKVYIQLGLDEDAQRMIKNDYIDIVLDCISLKIYGYVFICLFR